MATNNFAGYRYRRYAFALAVGLVAWTVYVAGIWLINPGDWLTVLIAVALYLAGGIPAAVLMLHFRNVARDEFAKLQPVLGVVLPKE